MAGEESKDGAADSPTPSVRPAPVKGKKREAVVDMVDAQPAPARQPSRPHHTRCKVVGSSVTASDGRLYPEGHVGEFADADVLSLPKFLIPVE